jgi:hypothetical protein
LPPKVDIRQRLEYVCFVPQADTGKNIPASHGAS